MPCCKAPLTTLSSNPLRPNGVDSPGIFLLGHVRLVVIEPQEASMRYAIIAQRGTQKVRMNRNSFLIAVAKAEVWASEGWKVTVVDNEDPTASTVLNDTS